FNVRGSHFCLLRSAFGLLTRLPYPAMSFTPAGSYSLASFIAVVGAVATAAVAGDFVPRRRRRWPPATAARQTFIVALPLLLWLALSSAVVASGIIAAAPMPRLLLFLALSYLAAIAYAL